MYRNRVAHYNPGMSLLRLPHTEGCLACGRSNPHGLKMDLYVDDASGTVHTSFTPTHHHIGFDGVIHGGLIATVVDEAMVWAATWAGRRFCLCGEMTVRFREPARVDEALRIEASVDLKRSKLVTTSCQVVNASGKIVAEASGKYVPIPVEQHLRVTETFAPAPDTLAAASVLRDVSG